MKAALSRCAAAALLLAAATAAWAADPGAAQRLRDTHRQLADQLSNSSLQRPVHLVSTETADGLQGDVYAVVEYPLEAVRSALASPAQWCEMLSLHINNRRCRTGRAAGADMLTLSVVRRYDKPLEDAFELPFVYRTVDSSAEYLAVELAAEEGPLGTRRYRVGLEAVPLGERRSFLHFGYAYDHSTMARLATMAYLATFGSHKLGFTVTGRSSDGRPVYIRGLRGLMERNAMRYFLTLDAYLGGMEAPAPERLEARQRRWFEAIEQYPTQLHEIDLATYLALKREDRQREQARARPNP